MTVSFLDNFAARENSPTLTVASPSVGNCQSGPTPDVSEIRHSHSLTDGEREAAIGLAASLVEYHTELHEISDSPVDMENANRARRSMEALIAGRTNQPKESHDGQA